MGFGSLIDEVVDQDKEVVVYAPDDGGADLADVLATRNLTVDHRRLPEVGAEPFVVVRDGDGFSGALSLSDLLQFLEPPIRWPLTEGSLDAASRAVYELLDNTVFVAMDRRQLLATTRELEDRAWRVGRGEIHAGFQRVAALDPQVDLYRELAETTDVEVHVYTREPVPTEYFAGTPVRTHTEPTDEVERFWFILFDDGDDGSQNCAMIAEQTDPGQYRGVWTYDPELVARAFEALE